MKERFRLKGCFRIDAIANNVIYFTDIETNKKWDITVHENAQGIIKKLKVGDLLEGTFMEEFQQ